MPGAAAGRSRHSCVLAPLTTFPADQYAPGCMRLDAVFPPIPTPFADGEVDAAAIAVNIARWMRTGLGGVVALGTNGEAALLDEDEADR
jgi:hypothetical protein